MANKPVRSKSRLKEGLTQMDYSSAKRIRAAFGDEASIRKEYTRMRDIIQKRVGRMEEAGETRNNFYRIFGKNPLPKLKDTTTKEMLMKMAPMARALSGAYSSDLRSVRAERTSAKEKLAGKARAAGDEESAQDFENLSDSQYEKIKIMFGILENVLGRNAFYQAELSDAVRSEERRVGKECSG